MRTGARSALAWLLGALAPHAGRRRAENVAMSVAREVLGDRLLRTWAVDGSGRGPTILVVVGRDVVLRSASVALAGRAAVHSSPLVRSADFILAPETLADRLPRLGAVAGVSRRIAQR